MCSLISIYNNKRQRTQPLTQRQKNHCADQNRQITPPPRLQTQDRPTHSHLITLPPLQTTRPHHQSPFQLSLHYYPTLAARPVDKAGGSRIAPEALGTKGWLTHGGWGRRGTAAPWLSCRGREQQQQQRLVGHVVWFMFIH
jgi:hypothetical protein